MSKELNKEPAEQAGGDERVVDGKPRATKCPDCGEGDLMPGDLCACGYETDPAAGYACSECDGSGEGCVGEVCRECDGSGWFVTPKHGQPHKAFNYFKDQHDAQVAHWRERGCTVTEDRLMTVSQHERIVGALRAENTKLSEALDESDGDRWKLRSERDAALARVAEMEKQKEFGRVIVSMKGGYKCFEFDEYSHAHSFPEGEHQLYAAPVAQAQQLHDLDKQCRDDVARALGLRPSQERGFAWSCLLASIKSCGKASEDTAQAQHSVPDGYRLIRLEHFAAIKAQLDPEQVDAYRGRNIYDEDKVYANWNACRSALDEIKDVFQQIDWDAENELAELLAAAPGKEVGHE